jgi:hypothetical protein
MKKADKQRPLTGVNVVDFGQYIAGPAVSMILADLGATVVHVDPPNGPLWDSPANAVLNRNKLNVRIDLKTDEGLADALALIERADVVVENFRPGVMSLQMPAANTIYSPATFFRTCMYHRQPSDYNGRSVRKCDQNLPRQDSSVQVNLLPLDVCDFAGSTTIRNKIACIKFKQNCSFGRQCNQFCILFDIAAESSP